MSDMSGIASITAAPGSTGEGGVTQAPELGGFDRDAALAEVGADGFGSSVDASEVSRLEVDDDAKPEVEAEVEAPEEKSAEAQTDEERLEARKKKLSDKDGKLDQSKVDRAFAKLTAEGKRLRAKSEAFKTERSTFEQAKAQYDAAIETAAQRLQARDAEHDKFNEAAKNSPLGVLEKFGWDVPKLIKFIQNDGKHSPEDLIRDTKSEYEKRFETQQKELEELRNSLKQDKVKTAANQYEANAIKTMEGLMEKYEFISKYDLRTEIAPKVLQNIAHIYREGGDLNGVKYPKGTALDPKTVLDYFEAQTAKEVSRFGIRPGQAGATSSVAKPGAAQPKALSNADTSSRGVKASDEDEPFDREAAWREVRNMYG
jgi:hypothetical protein